MNLLDKAIGFFSPSSGLKRAQNRKAIEALEKRGKYSNSSTLSKKISNQTPTNESIVYMPELRERARNLENQSGLATHILDLFEDEVVGSGIATQFRSRSGKNEKLVKEIETAFKNWALSNKPDFYSDDNYYGLQGLFLRSIIRDGSVFFRNRFGKDKDISYKVQLIENDFLCPDKQSENYIRGIKVSDLGIPLGYEIYKFHPQDTYKGRSTVFISSDDMKLVFDKKRVGQLAGMSWFARAIDELEDIGDTFDAELVKRKIASCFAGIIQNKFIEAYDAETDEESDYEADLDFSTTIPKGGFKKLPPGQEIVFPNPPSTEGFSAFMESQLRRIALSFGLSYEAVAMDYSRVSYSSGRLGRIQQDKTINRIQDKILIPKFCRPVSEKFLENYALKNNISEDVIRDIYPTFIKPKKTLVDPAKDAEGVKRLIRAGLKSHETALIELGEDPDEVYKSIEKTNKIFDEKGFVLDTDPRVTDQNGSASKESKNEK